VLYEPMKWIYFAGRADGAAYSDRRTSILPCRPEVRLDVVPVDYVADAVVGLAFAPTAAGGTFHLSAGEPAAVTIGETVELLHAAANRHASDHGEPPIAPPVIVSPEMVAGNDELQELYAAGEAVMSAYLPYAITEQVFDPAGTAAVLGPAFRPCPHPRGYYDTLAAFALTRNFGRVARA
jgi:long-chain acyl-CoA synthetase